MSQRILVLDQHRVRCVRRLYRLTMPRAIKTKTTNSEIKVRIPQMSVTLLLRTAVSSLLQRLVTRLAARILPKQKSLEPRRTPSWSVRMSGQAHRTGAAPCYRNFANTTSSGTYHSRDSLESRTTGHHCRDRVVVKRSSNVPTGHCSHV